MYHYPMEKTWYLFWFMTFQTDGGLIQHQLESRQLQPSQQLCVVAMTNKQRELENLLDTDLYVFGNTGPLWMPPPDPQWKLGRAVGYTIGCEARDFPWGDEPIISKRAEKRKTFDRRYKQPHY